MNQKTQQELLQDLKEKLGGTWDEVAQRTGISPRTLKSYCLPVDSKGFRSMNKFARQAVLVLLVDE